jgi:hypothetical protein
MPQSIHVKKICTTIIFVLTSNFIKRKDSTVKDNSTGKNKDFYDLGKQMFDRIQPLKPKTNPIQADIDLLYQANSADVEALEDAKITLNVIKEVDPGVYDEIIDSSLALINKALGMSYSDAMERVAIKAGGQ